jgi:hypothetical protein
MGESGTTPAARIGRRLRRGVRDLRLRLALRHRAGPRRFALAPDDVVVVALVRDGIYWLDAFLAHYRGIGARHFVFIDNGSQDGTPTRLAREPDCAVLAADLPWGPFENALRGAAARRHCAGHWCLYADMDEIFELPPGFADLCALARHLRGAGHTALVAQMLEMFPDAPLAEVRDLPYDAVLKRFDHCDIGQIRRFAYHDPAIDFAWFLARNRIAEPGTPILFGGVRARVFGENCCLTKHPLVFLDGSAQPGVHPHCAAHVSCAGFTGLIRHYKFAGDAFARDRATAARAVIHHGEDLRRLAVAAQAPDLSLMGPEARPYAGQMDLHARGFLTGAAHLRPGGVGAR